MGTDEFELSKQIYVDIGNGKIVPFNTETEVYEVKIRESKES